MELSLQSENLRPFIDEDGHIVITFINAGYFDYIYNLSINLRRIDVPWKLCVVCTDEEALALCQSKNIGAVYFNANKTKKDDLDKISSYSDSNWNAIMFMKLEVVQWITRHPEVKKVTYMDGDIHVYRDFVPYLKTLSVPPNELIIQSDYGEPDITQYHHRVLCGGFFHFAKGDRVAKVFEYEISDINKYKVNADQDHIIHQVHKYGIHVHQLRRDWFPNGVFYNSLPPDPYIYHYNWMVGSAKKDNMNARGHWYLYNLKLLRHPTDIVYPPFLKGHYLEEYFSLHNTKGGYIDAYWTNLQNDPRFNHGFNRIVQESVDDKYPPTRHYFTLVQHDDGIRIQLPPNTTVYGAGGTGDVPIPLIYEDTDRKLESFPKKSFQKKGIVCSFVGSITHEVRQHLMNQLHQKPWFQHTVVGWTNQIDQGKQDSFVETTRNSRFCLAPRGYGRTSFRFYEAFQLGSIPIYVWDDIEWLPYKEFLDYSKFCVSIHVSRVHELESILLGIDEAKYEKMWREYEKIKHWFTLEGMTQYILERESA